MAEELPVAVAFWTMIVIPIAVFIRLMLRAPRSSISGFHATRRFFG